MVLEVKELNLPPEYQNVMITYIGSARVRDKYYDHYETMQVTRRAFYTRSDGYYDSEDQYIKTPNGYFAVPQFWEKRNGIFMPHKFCHHPRVLPENIIKWEYEK